MAAKKPWHGLVPREFAERLAREYSLYPEFPLQDRLSEAIYWLKHRIDAHPTHDKRGQAWREDIERAHETGQADTLAAAIAVGLWNTNNPKEAAIRAESGTVRLALRELMKGDKAPGKAKDWPRQSFSRALGAIYEDGTGRKPSTGGRSGKFRGRAFRFAKEVCDWVSSQPGFPTIRAHRSLIQHLHYRRINALNK